MLCDNCIKILTLNLSKDSKLILSVLSKQQANQNIIMQLSKLSYAVVTRTLNELKGSGFVQFTENGRSKEYCLSKSGIRLFQLYEKEKGGR